MKFDLELAIKEKGNCSKQEVKCTDCTMGMLIYILNKKDRLTDMCFYKDVHIISNFVKKIYEGESK